MRGRSCAVGRARSVVRGSACVVVVGRARSVMRGHAWSCVVVRGRSCAVVRGRAYVVGHSWSCAVVRARSCRSARFAASTAVTRSNNPLNPPGVGWVKCFYPIKVRVSMGNMRAKFGSDPTAGSKIVSFKFISR